MLPKKFRLSLKTEFPNTQNQSRRINGLLFDLLVGKNKDLIASKFAFVVSKKIDKRSTVRHRLKRLLSEAVRQFLLQTKPGFKIVFFAKKTLVDKTFLEIKKEVEAVFKKKELLITN